MIEVIDVYKSFKDVHAVKGIRLHVKEGSFVGLLGPNGAGKTTLVEMIEGIQKPDKGEIIIYGKIWHHHQSELRKMIGLSFQETHFIDRITVFETLKMFCSFYNLSTYRANEIINLVGLEEKRKARVENLSGGQRQRLSLGIALLNKPKVILLDEPTTGLDPNARREIWNILIRLRKETGTSMLLTTHYMEEAEQLCDYIVIMDHGKILKEGTPDLLLSEDHHNRVVEFTLDSKDLNLVLADFGTEFEITWDSVKQKGTLTLSSFEQNISLFLNLLNNKGFKLKELEYRKKTLDDLFINLTGRHLNE
jgi:ABC-2 type transport system ATP-binding protein